jgi:DNA polymerase III sliding clamp (beta) subunit (PCNA family)
MSKKNLRQKDGYHAMSLPVTSKKRKATVQPPQSEGQIKRTDLLTALSRLKPGLATKDIIERGVCFNFLGDSITTSNDFINVMVPMATALHGAVKAEEFYKLLDKIPGEQLSLSMDGNELRLSSGRIKAGMVMMGDPIRPTISETDFFPLPPDFKEAMTLTSFSASRDFTRPALSSIHFQGKSVVSSDNWRITKYEMDSPIPQDFLLPIEAAIHLVKYAPTHISLDGGWVYFMEESTNIVFSSRLKSGASLQVDQFFEDATGGQILQLPNQLLETLDRTKIMVEGDSDIDMQIKLILTDGTLTCHGRKDIGWIEESMEIDYHGDQVIMIINPIFLADILSRASRIILGETSCLFQGDKFQHLMMLVGE